MRRWSCETSIDDMGVQSFAWKWNADTSTHVVVPSLFIVATIYSEIIKMVTNNPAISEG
jgi:hypothetical protein